MHDDRSIEEYKKLSQQVKYNGKDNCDIVEDYKKLLQQLKEYKEKIVCMTKELLKFIKSY